MSNDACLTYTLIAVLLIGGLGAGFYVALHLSPLAASLLAVNLGTLLIYRYDKYASMREGAQRAPNLFLAALVVLGPLGALFGIYLEVLPGESHKTGGKYWWLRLLVALFLVIHLALLAAYVLVGGEDLLNWARSLLA